MGKVIAIINQKGGVGKTTTAINLAYFLSAMNKKILLIDIDPQGNTTSGLGYQKSRFDRSIYHVLIDSCTIEEVIFKTEYENLFLAPSNEQLAGAEIEMVPMIGREMKLREAIKDVKDQYDYIFMDCPPSLGLLPLNSITASDSILIPIQCEYFALEGLGQLIQTFNLVKKRLNPQLFIQGVVLTMYDTRLNLAKQVADEVQKYFDGKVVVYHTKIPRNVRISEAPSFGKPVEIYAPHSLGAVSYMDFAKEFLYNDYKESFRQRPRSTNSGS
jgi:chromosome partitioning protein